MFQRAYRTSLLMLYQLTVILGILLMPLALAARRMGVKLPIRRLVESVDRTYTEAAGSRPR